MQEARSLWPLFPAKGYVSRDVAWPRLSIFTIHPREQTGDKCDIIREKFTVDDIPGFTLTDLTRDMALCDKIEAATGLDIPRDLASVAGGDPSGREPDREHATKEVLDESDRREDEDEDALHDRIEEIEKELEEQPEAVSPSKPVEKPAPAPSDKDSDRDSGGSDSGTTTPDPTPPGPEPEPEPPVYTITFQANGGEWNGETERTVRTAAGGTVTLPEAPTRSGYTFSGWYDAPEGGTALPAGSVFTADTTLYAHWDGWYYDAGSNTLTVAGAGAMDAYYKTVWDPGSQTNNFVPQWLNLGTSYTIQNVVILEGVTNIGCATSPGNALYVGAFEGCNDLSSVTIPRGVTSIGDRAFAYCSGLTSVTLLAGVTSIGNDAFYECASLASITIPGGVTRFEENSFFNCTALRAIEFTGTQAQWNGIVKTDSKLSAGITVTCTDGTITTVIIESGITSIGDYAFQGCTSLTSVDIPDGVTSIWNSAFYNCSSLTSVDIPASVTSIGPGVFNSCTGLTSITVDAGNPVYSSDDIALFNKGKTTLIKFPEGRGGAYSIPATVTSIENYTFSGCSGLTSVTIPDSVTSIGRDTFESCSSLTTINFGGTADEWTTLTNGVSIGIPDTATVYDKDGQPIV